MEILRTCAFSHKLVNRSEMFRIVKDNKGMVFIDDTYSKNGRGAYLIKDIEIIKKAKHKSTLSKALRCNVEEGIYDEMIKRLGGE